MGPIDLVIDVRGVGPADAALWIAERFPVPFIPARKGLGEPGRRRDRVGHERGLGLLIRSGLWARLTAPAQAIAAVLLEFGEKERLLDDTLRVKMAYRTLARYTGVQSHNAIRKGLVELAEVGFLILPAAAATAALDRQTAAYIVTPNSQALWELAQATARQTQQEIDAEIEQHQTGKPAALPHAITSGPFLASRHRS
jgi:hypothetical protein